MGASINGTSLGATVPFYRSFAEMAALDPEFFSAFPALSAVVTQAERGGDAPPWWTAELRSEASAFLRKHLAAVSPNTREVLVALSHTD